MLKTRSIIQNSDGTYQGIFGQLNRNFIYGADALAQILKHQLLTVKGELKTRTDFGVDWFGNQNNENTKLLLDIQIKNILINNFYVTNILNFSSNLDLQNNTYNATIKVATSEGVLLLTI